VFVHVPLTDPCALSQPSQRLPWCITPGSPHCGRLILTGSQQPLLALSIYLPLSQSNVQSHQEMLPLSYQQSKYPRLLRQNLGPPWLSLVHQYYFFHATKNAKTLISASSLPIQYMNLLYRWVMTSWELGRSSNTDFGCIATRQFRNTALLATAND